MISILFGISYRNQSQVRGDGKHFTVRYLRGIVKHTHLQNFLTELSELPLALIYEEANIKRYSCFYVNNLYKKAFSSSQMLLLMRPVATILDSAKTDVSIITDRPMGSPVRKQYVNVWTR